jgi:hypothetical protein
MGHLLLRPLRSVMILIFCWSGVGWTAEGPSKEGSLSGLEVHSRTGAPPETRVSPARLEALKTQLDQIKVEYEKRIRDLEAQVQQLQLQMLQAVPESQLIPSPQQAESRPVQSIPGALNPAIAVIGNFIGRADSQKVFEEGGERIDNRFNLREAEIDMRVPIDPYADGVLVASFESAVPGTYRAEVEEGYAVIKKLPFLDRPPLGLKLKAGRFRPAFGQLNILHDHDLPQTFRPLPTEEFLGAEGFIQNGISGNFFLPTPWDAASSLDATVEVLNGGDIAFLPRATARTSYLGHLRWFRTLKDVHNLQLGWSTYFHPAGNQVSSATLHGIDFTYRWKPLRQGQWKSYLFGAEWMLAPRATPAQAGNGTIPGGGKPKGYFAFGQAQFDRRTYAGVRWDQTDTVFNPAVQRRSLTPYLSYYFSEFFRFRLNYEHRWSYLDSENGRNSVYMELNFVFGAHPAEPFWVNK